MTPWWWSVLLAVVGVAGLYIAGRKSWIGWAIGLTAQLLWVAYALVSGQWGFLLSAGAYGWVYATNWIRWRRDTSSDPAPPEVTLHPSTLLRWAGHEWAVLQTTIITNPRRATVDLVDPDTLPGARSPR